MTASTLSDVAVSVNTPQGFRLVSWFDVITEAVFQEYRTRGVVAHPAHSNIGVLKMKQIGILTKWVQLSTLCLTALALLCWVVMFLAGTDVWHDVGRPDFGNLQGPPYDDLRAFVFAFYLLLMVLSVNLIVTALGLVTARRRARMHGA